ncbi:MAG TPA: GNAT family N-acetyltransferase [Acidimicrobiia bacterium]|nr:GNAT family N-acetyltransferase [Acidimicrobiia bacterium]
MGAPVILEVDPEDPRAVYAVGEYGAELERVLGFAAISVTVTGQEHYRRPHGAFFIVEMEGQVMGCGAVRTITLPDGSRAAEMKRMWLAPGLRGRGVGRDLLHRLHAAGRELGHHRAVLDSRRELEPALRLYGAAGYEEVPPFNDNPDATVWMARTL